MTALSRSSLVLSLMALLLVSCAAPRIAESQALRAQVGAYQLEVLVDGQPARSFSEAGESYILGEQGSRYVLRVHNRSGRRIEAVVSVDGLDVIDGKSADFANKRGYLVAPYSHVDIEGFRLSAREAAVFRFAPISESYAAKTGKARNVGVIGVAVFPERVRRVQHAYTPRYPDYESSYRSRREEADDFGGLGSSAEAKGRADEERPSPAAASAPTSSRRAAAESGGPGSGAAADSHAAPRKRASRGGLGTEFGEPVWSEIRQVEFVRAHASAPSALLGARYNDRAGLLALGIDVDGYDEASDLALRQSARPFPVSQRGFARPPADWRRD